MGPRQASSSTEKPKGAKAPTKAKKTRGQKKTEPTEEGQTKRISVKWSENLVYQLLGAIEDNPEIRQGLYPGTGANVSTAKGGGKPKTEFYWQLGKYGVVQCPM